MNETDQSDFPMTAAGIYPNTQLFHSPKWNWYPFGLERRVKVGPYTASITAPMLVQVYDRPAWPRRFIARILLGSVWERIPTSNLTP